MKLFYRIAGCLIIVLGLFLSAMPTPVFAQLEQCSPNEAWMPVGLGLPGGALRAEILNDKLYVISHIPGFSNRRLGLFTWDGLMWILVSELEVDFYFDVKDMKAYDGSLYVSGEFKSVNGLPGTDGLVRWDGTAWSGVPGKPSDEAITQNRPYSEYPLAVYNGELYTVVDTGSAHTKQSLAIWNGTSWRMVEIPSDANMWITSFAELNGDLYVGGYSNRSDGVESYGVIRWDGPGWTAVGQEGMENVSSLFVYQNQLYAFIYENPMVNPQVLRLDGEQWHPIPELFPRSVYENMTFRNAPMVEHDGKLYIVGFNELFNTGIIVRWDGTNVENVVLLNTWSWFLIEYKGELYTGGPFTSSCKRSLPYVARFCTDCQEVSGRVMAEPSADCVDDSLAVGDPGRIVRMTPNVQYAITDEHGRYSMMTEPGTHSLQLLSTKRHWQQLCPLERVEQQVTMPDPPVPVSGINFAVGPIPNRRDLGVSIAGARVRPMTTTRYTVRCSNPGTVPIQSGILSFMYDEHLLRPENIVPEPIGRAAGSVYWDLSDFYIDPGAEIDFTIDCTVLPAVQAGDVVCTEARVATLDERFPDNNHDSVCVAAVNSYDPNDLAVLPAGAGESGMLSSRDTILTYTVRFQNTGSDTAYRVVVVDTLSPNLDLTSLRLGASSHPFKLRLINGGALMFIFDTIGLPHQKANDIESQGYFKFSIALKNGLPAQTEIKNRASIYFDYNEAIITNAVLSTVGEPVAAVPDESPAAIKMFPNPARGVLYLRGAILTGSTLVIRDLAGREIRSLRYESIGDAEIDLAGLSSGTYLIDVETASGRETHRFVVAR